LALCVVGAVAIPALSELDYQQQFTDFVGQFNKAYTADAFFFRYGIFKSNLDMIREHNSKGLSWTLGVNQFADMTAAEFEGFVGQFPQPPTTSTAVPQRLVDAAVPTALEWGDKGAVAAIKDQGQCGSCWAFATSAVVESWWFIKNGLTGKIQDLSAQQLVDCSKDTCYGCQGGWPYKALEYVEAKGLCSWTGYGPYTARDGTCKDTQCTPVVTPGAMTGYLNVSGEPGILQALQQGPVSVLVEADTSAFQFYHSGVLDNPACGSQIDHAILATGYGVLNGKNFWNVKNSWGSSWGDKGYIKIVRDKKMCAIDQGPTQPLF